MILSYFAERLRPVPFLPLACALAAAAGAGRYELPTLAADLLFGALLLAEFRLWDDLADRRADSKTHPGRVLVRAAATRRFVALCVSLAIVNLALCVLRDGVSFSVAVLVLLHVTLGGWYSRRGGRTVAGDQLLLAKYPAFVLVLAGSRLFAAPATTVLAAAAIYAVASAYEAWHDPVSPLGTLLGGRS